MNKIWEREMNKLWRANVPILCTLLKYLYIICTCVNIKQLDNQLIGYLKFISVIGNLETTD